MTIQKSRRVERAKERQKAYDALTTAEKLANINACLGEGVGAGKQRAKLAARLEREKNQVAKKEKKEQTA